MIEEKRLPRRPAFGGAPRNDKKGVIVRNLPPVIARSERSKRRSNLFLSLIILSEVLPLGVA